ncbi:hypothetical protein Tco_1286713 [Tanacetum coccineum]
MLKCVIPNWFLAWRNLDSRVIDESPAEGFTPDDLLKLCCRCAKLRNIADVVFVRSGLNASWYNLLAIHTAILATEDTCFPDPTPDEVIVSNVDPTVVGKSFDLVRSFDLVQSFDLVRSFNFVESFDLVWSFDRRTRKRVNMSVILLPHVFPIDPDRAEGLRLMQSEDHQMLGNEQKLEEDAPDCTRVDDDGVEFSTDGGDYFPTMGDETKKDKCFIFLLLLIICLEIFKDLTVFEDALDRSLSLAEILKIETMSSLGPLN